jgi:hypothetical protein
MRTKEYFEILRLKAEDKAFELAERYYEQELKKFSPQSYECNPMGLSKEDFSKLAKDAVYAKWYCHARLHESSIKYFEQIELYNSTRDKSSQVEGECSCS